MKERCCENCRYSEIDTGGCAVAYEFRCLRHAPTNPKGDGPNSYDCAVWPFVKSDYWCGDWEPIEAVLVI